MTSAPIISVEPISFPSISIFVNPSFSASFKHSFEFISSPFSIASVYKFESSISSSSLTCSLLYLLVDIIAFSIIPSFPAI